MKNIRIGYLLLWFSFFAISCDSFLDVKPAKTLATPNTLVDIRALLDDEENVNRFFAGVLELGTDDYYLTDNTLSQVNVYDRAFYFWEDEGNALNFASWLYPYKAITVANVALESLKRIDASGLQAEILEGEAYFIRAFALFNLAQVYCDAYDPSVNNAERLGLPLRLNSDTKGPAVRSNLKQTYDQILADISQASVLLPEQTEFITRANRTAAFALKARVYLAMSLYEEAERMTDEVLERKKMLLDYNKVDVGSDFSFGFDNPELIFHGFSKDAMQILTHPNCYVDSMLIDQYEVNDLRKKIFFRSSDNKNYTFKGGYSGTFASYFGGLAMDEVYFNKMECLVRRGRGDESLTLLNEFLTKRFVVNKFDELQVKQQDELLKLILKERRKQLLFRGLRWGDLKRLNKDARFSKTLQRKKEVDGRTAWVNLEPNNLKYSYLIPKGVLIHTPYAQNPR